MNDSFFLEKHRLPAFIQTTNPKGSITTFKEFNDSLNIKSELKSDLGANYLKNTQRLQEHTLEVTLNKYASLLKIKEG